MNAAILRDPPRLRFEVRVQPRSSRNRIAGAYGSALKIQLAAPPVDGAANAALVAYLAAAMAIPKGAVRLVAGEHARSKIIEIETSDPAVLLERLQALAKPGA